MEYHNTHCLSLSTLSNHSYQYDQDGKIMYNNIESQYIKKNKNSDLGKNKEPFRYQSLKIEPIVDININIEKKNGLIIKENTAAIEIKKQKKRNEIETPFDIVVLSSRAKGFEGMVVHKVIEFSFDKTEIQNELSSINHTNKIKDEVIENKFINSNKINKDIYTDKQEENKLGLSDICDIVEKFGVIENEVEQGKENINEENPQIIDNDNLMILEQNKEIINETKKKNESKSIKNKKENDIVNNRNNELNDSNKEKNNKKQNSSLQLSILSKSNEKNKIDNNEVIGSSSITDLKAIINSESETKKDTLDNPRKEIVNKTYKKKQNSNKNHNPKLELSIEVNKYKQNQSRKPNTTSNKNSISIKYENKISTTNLYENLYKSHSNFKPAKLISILKKSIDFVPFSSSRKKEKKVKLKDPKNNSLVITARDKNANENGKVRMLIGNLKKYKIKKGIMNIEINNTTKNLNLVPIKTKKKHNSINASMNPDEVGGNENNNDTLSVTSQKTTKAKSKSNSIISVINCPKTAQYPQIRLSPITKRNKQQKNIKVQINSPTSFTPSSLNHSKSSTNMTHKKILLNDYEYHHPIINHKYDKHKGDIDNCPLCQKIQKKFNPMLKSKSNPQKINVSDIETRTKFAYKSKPSTARPTKMQKSSSAKNIMTTGITREVFEKKMKKINYMLNDKSNPYSTGKRKNIRNNIFSPVKNLNDFHNAQLDLVIMKQETKRQSDLINGYKQMTKFTFNQSKKDLSKYPSILKYFK